MKTISQSSSKIGIGGTIVLPKKMRERFGLVDGAPVTAEAVEAGILIKPVAKERGERYTPRQVAEFLLTNAIDEKDYLRACDEVRDLGLDPAKIRHRKPSSR